MKVLIRHAIANVVASPEMESYVFHIQYPKKYIWLTAFHP